ncbi:MAG: sulfur carrier protein ThiS [Deltaproteobacteria bacterium]|nr:sulfur carrier protein ThiS [Deltaproteobacteria bacterium]
MIITINGNSEEISDGSILTYIKGKGLAPEALVVEHNYKIVKKDKWDQTLLQENDNLEILSFVGGG